jgi:hypothetical protein
MVMVVKKPRVNVAFAQYRLDGIEIHGQTSIVNKSKDLGESGRAVPRKKLFTTKDTKSHEGFPLQESPS